MAGPSRLNFFYQCLLKGVLRIRALILQCRGIPYNSGHIATLDHHFSLTETWNNNKKLSISTKAFAIEYVLALV